MSLRSTAAAVFIINIIPITIMGIPCYFLFFLYVCILFVCRQYFIAPFLSLPAPPTPPILLLSSCVDWMCHLPLGRHCFLVGTLALPVSGAAFVVALSSIRRIRTYHWYGYIDSWSNGSAYISCKSRSIANWQSIASNFSPSFSHLCVFFSIHFTWMKHKSSWISLKRSIHIS